MAGRFMDMLGTTLSKLQIGIDAAALNLKSATGKLRVRNKADTLDMPLVGSVIAASGDFLEINEDAASAGADWKLTLARAAAGMTAGVTLTFPPTAGSPAQVLSTDGAGNLSWASVAAGSDKLVTDTTTIGFGSVSPVALFSLPANAIVQALNITIDTPFNGTPSLSVGVTGTVSKYLGAGSVDLTAAATIGFDVEPGLASVASIEALIATYAAGGATAGSARILVSYSIPS
jgi:hypothetical protein